MIKFSGFNPFSARLAVLYVTRKTTNKSAKREIIKSSHEHVKGLLCKCTVLKEDLLYNHQIYCFQACMCALFSPNNLQDGAVNGLRHQEPGNAATLANPFVRQSTFTHSCKAPKPSRKACLVGTTPLKPTQNQEDEKNGKPGMISNNPVIICADKLYIYIYTESICASIAKAFSSSACPH